MKRLMQWVGIILLLSLLVSCGGKEQPTVLSVTPTGKPLTIVATDKPIQVETATELPFQFATPTIASLLGDCWVPTGLTSQESPDGQWIAAPCELGESSHLKIVNKRDASAWELSFQEITGMFPCLAFTNSFGETDCFEGTLRIEHWETDSRYVFVNVNYLVDRPFDFSYGLYRLDVKTRQVSPWLTTSPNFMYRYEFSSDNKKLAYVASADPNTLYINSIETGQVFNHKIPSQVSEIVYLTWSPDNQKVAFSIIHGEWFNDPNGFSLGLLDIKDGKITQF
ncbi:MAG: hypothetical protein WCC12_22480 [Anaerolineales bacterium]